MIELLVVIAIIGILSSVVLASLNTAREKARDAQRKSDLHQISVALELYYDANGTYTIPGTGYSGNSTGWYNYEGGGTYVKSIAHGLSEAGLLKPVRDPSLTSDGQTPQYMKYDCLPGYFIYAKLERPSAQDLAIYANSKAQGCANLDSYGMNYAVGHQ